MFEQEWSEKEGAEECKFAGGLAAFRDLSPILGTQWFKRKKPKSNLDLSKTQKYTAMDLLSVVIKKEESTWKPCGYDNGQKIVLHS